MSNNDKVSKREAEYRPYGKGGQRCAVCTMFRRPASCTTVAGPIEAGGWCSYFERVLPSRQSPLGALRSRE